MQTQKMDQLVQMAANNEDQYNSLLAYYRSKIGEFDQERMEWLSKFEELRIQYEDKHKLEWDLLKRKEEISELQRSLSETKCMLFEERQLSLRLQKENDMLKVKELEDRKKIQELLALTDPIEEQIVLCKDIRPEITAKYKENRQSLQSSIGKARSVIKTIYLPNEQLNSVSYENDQLKQSLEQAQLLLSQQFTELKSEINRLEEDSRRLRQQDENQIRQQQQKLQSLEKANVECNKGIGNMILKVLDFYTLKQRMGEKEKKYQEDHEIVNKRNKVLVAKIQEVEKKNNKENKAAIVRELLEKKTDEYTKKFKNQVKVKDDNLQVLKEQYAQIQQIYIQKIQQLEENLSKLVLKYQNLEKRRVLEIEGFKNDIKTLNGKVKEYEKNLSAQKSSRRVQQEEDMEKYEKEAKELKKEALQSMVDTYSPQKKKKTIKKKGQQQQTKKQTKKIDLAGQKDEQQDDFEEEEESIPMQELEYIQRQLDELERQMDMAKKH